MTIFTNPLASLPAHITERKSLKGLKRANHLGSEDAVHHQRSPPLRFSSPPKHDTPHRPPLSEFSS